MDSSSRRNLSFFVILSIVINSAVAYPAPVLAQEALDGQNDAVIENIEESPALIVAFSRLNIHESLVIKEHPARSVTVVATAYTSSVEETDSTPCITANGFNVCKNNSENVIAANFLPFGTRVRIPDMYGDRVFVVNDRMNARYGYGRVDLWMKSKQSARQFGVKRLKMEILEDHLALGK